MAIKPVSGEIKAQPLNDNFSYLDSKASSMIGGPKETFTSLSALNTKYPNGSASAMLVTDSNGANGYLYTWNGSAWIKGPLYQAQGIADNSVDEKKTTKPTLKATVIVAATPPNYDRTTKIFKFNGTSSAQDIIIWGSGTSTSQYLVPVGLEIENTVSGTSAFKLTLNVETKEFRIVAWSTSIEVNELLIASCRIGAGNKHFFYTDFPVTVDGFLQNDFDSKMPTVQILGGGSVGNVLPKISSSNKTLTFPSGYDWIFSIDGQTYANAIPSTGLTLDLTQLSGTSAHYIIFKMKSKEISIIPWTDLSKYSSGYAMLGTIRLQGSSYSIFLPFPFLLDNKLFGYHDDNQTSVSVSLNAPIKCIHHRGYSRKYPENTEVAYKGSKKLGVNEVEMDLVFTSDEVPVNLHDMTINRTARNNDGTQIEEEKNITEITYEEASQYDYGLWKGAEFKGQKLMSFEDAILICKKLDMRLHIDRASAHNSERLNIVKEIMVRNNFDNVLFYGYDVAGIDRIRSIFPNSSIVYLLSSTDITETIVDACVIRNQDGFCGIIAYAPMLTAEGTTLATSRGVEVYVWGADSVNRSELAEWGVTGISTDFANIQQEIIDM